MNNFVANEMARRPDGPPNEQIKSVIAGARTKFEAALRDDLNTSVAFAVIHEFMTAVNRLQPSASDAEHVIGFMGELDSVFGVIDPITESESLDLDIQQLIDERIQARSDRDFQRADEIRDDLLAKGIELIDTPQGTEWRKI